MKKKTEVKYPKGEHVWTRYYNKALKLKYIITSKETNRETYYLYELEDGVLRKLGKSKSPSELEEKFKVNEELRTK